MKIGGPSSSSTTSTDLGVSGADDIERIRAERARIEGEMVLSTEDEFAKIERLHQNSLKALPAIGAKSPTANVGKGPAKGDAGTGMLAEFVPVSVKA